MPGNADSSQFRELINFHYIKKMAFNIKKVVFMIVINIEDEENIELDKKDIQMIETFIQTFPNCSGNVHLIVNRMASSVKEDNFKKAFRKLLGPESNNLSIKKYFKSISDERIHLIKRPKYLNGQQGKLHQPTHSDLP